LLESEKKYRTILKSIEDGYFEVNQRGEITFFNEAFSEITGYPSDELMGMENDKYLDQENREKVFKKFNEVWKTGIPTKLFEYELIRKNGEKRTVQTSVSLVTDENGQKIGFRGIIRDVSDLKQAENALRESEERYKVITDSALDAIIEIGPHGKVTHWNPAAEKMFGYTKGDIMEKVVHDYLMPDKFREQYEIGFEKFRETGTGPAIGQVLELTAIHKDGHEFPMEIVVSPIKKLGQYWASAIIRDITERKLAEEELIKTKARLEHLLNASPAVIY